jgi:hypothetical protein
VLGLIGNQSVNELVALTFTAGATDSDLPTDTLSYSLVGAPIGASINPTSGAFTWTPTEAQGPNTYTFDVCVSDGTASDCETIIVTVAEVNAVPQVGEIVALDIPLVINSTFSASATYSDIDAPETLTAKWIWEDGTNTTQTLTGTLGITSASHVYSLTGVYNVQLVITDSAGASITKLFRYAVIYDPNAGFVTGGGWINSQAGWCTLRASCAVASKAELGYQAKYKKNSTIPTGEIEFQAKGFHLHSTSVEWLVISGAASQVKGQATIEGVTAPNGSFIFQVWSTDASPDTFRLRVWWEDVAGIEHTVYDTNGVNQVLGGGNIKIHR